MGQHVAIKCTYNDGGEGIYVGFNGTCSEEIIKLNIESGRVWCSQPTCQCRKYYDNGFKGKKPSGPCYESVLFRDWIYKSGWYHTGKKAGNPIRLSNVGIGKIAIFTTRFPGDEEIDRRIIGFFKIGQVINEPGEETIMVADREFRVRLPLEEAKELYFWDYYSTRGGARWGTGLIRYLNDNQVARILADLRETLRDEKAKAMVDTLLTKDFSHISPPPASGPRAKISGNRTKRISTSRKYGPGGEGEEHRKLKEWIAQNPQNIGLTNVKKVEIEYDFKSGDSADIVFELYDNTYVEEKIEEKEEEKFEEVEEPWTKTELLSYLKDTTPYQRMLIAALAQVDKEPATTATVTFLMNEIAKRRPSEGIDKKITGRDIAGARFGLNRRRKPLKKEDIIESSWIPSEHNLVYKIKDDYKQIVIDWAKREKLWIKE